MHSATSWTAVLALAYLAWVTSMSVTQAAPLSFTVQLAGSQ
jgi:hypothetical protein